MASGLTNRGVYRMLDIVFRGATIPTNFYVALVTDAPTPDTNVMSDLTEIAAGNGYTSGGYQLTPNSTDFDTLTEDDTNDLAKVLIKDVSWTASGGNIPSSGSDAAYAVLTNDNATVANRDVWAWWDLVSGRAVASGADFLLQDLELDGTN